MPTNVAGTEVAKVRCGSCAADLRSNLDDRYRRDPAVGPGVGEGRLSHALQTFITTYALASRLRASWIEARVTKMARVSARFSKSLARRRLRPNQEKVRSTTRRRGRTTKPFMSSLRLTISIRSSGTFATVASTCPAL